MNKLLPSPPGERSAWKYLSPSLTTRYSSTVSASATPDEIAGIWSDMLNATSRSGELLNVLLHPERSRIVAKSLDSLLDHATHTHHFG